MDLLRKLKAFVFPEIDAEIRCRMIQNNTRNMTNISVVAVVVESLILLILLLTTPDPWPQEKSSIISILFCIAVSALVRLLIFVLKRIAGRSDSEHKPLCCQENMLLFLYFVLMIHWGMMVSLRHFRADEQMITFFILEMIFVGFSTIHPSISLILIFGSFFEFYQILAFYGDISRLDVLNYSGMALLCYLTSAAKYHRQIGEIRAGLKVTALNERLQGLSLTDPLTSIGNRLAVRKRVEEVVGSDICVMLADVDYFKEFNDNGGHEIGDKVLIHIAIALQTCFPVGSYFRYGGDEFLVITTGISPEDFIKRRDRWIRKVEAKRFSKIDRSICCSTGFVSGKPMSEIDVRNMIHEADIKLYAEKKIHHEMDCPGVIAVQD